MAMYRENRRTNSPAIDLAAMDQARTADPAAAGEKPVAVNGYQQVVEMLEAADPIFRESLLSRISRRDPDLGRSLRAHFTHLARPE